MFEAVDSPWRVPYDGSFKIRKAVTVMPDRPRKAEANGLLAACIQRLNADQDVLYAQDRYSVLLIFQAMDGAGKDSTIRAVMTGINPAGCQVTAFKKPTPHELDHDFLWRTSQHLPERGRFGIFNRSYYEEVLVVRVHPELLAGQRLPDMPSTEALFEGRYESIRDHEKHLARNGTVILKFFLHVSKEEQRERLIARIDDPAKNWKFDAADLHGRANWDAYQAAYERALRETSRPWAPWFVIPADNKPAMQYLVADIVARTLESMKLRYPKLDPDGLAALAEARKQLDSEAG